MSKGTFFKFFLIILVIVAAFVGYRFFFASSGSDTQVGLVSLSPANTGRAGSDQFVSLLASLRAINLNDLPRVITLLNGLEDFSTVLPTEAPGRTNPFLPIGKEAAAPPTSLASSSSARSSATSTASTTKPSH